MMSIITTTAIWLLTWKYVTVPFPTMLWGWIVIQIIYITGLFFAVNYWYMKGETDETEAQNIGFTADD